MALSKETTVRELMMKGPVTLKCDDILDLASDVMLEKKIGCLPVVEQGALVGLLTESDLLRCVAEL
jgi:acetoin utilization protein AcuB